MIFKRFLLVFAFLHILTSITFAATDIKVAVNSVTDVRSTSKFYEPMLQVELIFKGEAVRNATGLMALEVIRAEDDYGKNLVIENSTEERFEFNSKKRFMMYQKVKLKGTDRSSENISGFEAKVKLLNATEENGGLIVKQYFREKPNEVFDDFGLEKYEIEITFLTKDWAEKLKKDSMEETEEKNFEEDLYKDFSGLFAGLLHLENGVTFKIKDPNNKFLAMNFYDDEGKEIKQSGPMVRDDLYSYGFKKPLPEFVTLHIYVASLKAIRSLKFKLKKIELP